MSFNIYAIVGYDSGTTSLNESLKVLSDVYYCSLEAIRIEDIVAIVTSVDENDLKINKDQIIKYANIIEKLSECYSLIPFRFGSIVKTIDDISDLFQSKHNIIIELLKQFIDKEEYSLRIMYSKDDKRYSYIADGQKDIEKIPNILTGESLNKNYLKIKYLNYVFEKERAEYSDAVKKNIECRLKKITDNILFIENRSNVIVVDVVLLIGKNVKNELIRIVSSIQKEYYEHNIMLTGPWPPYNFSNL
jgi:hypothetical protein